MTEKQKKLAIIAGTILIAFVLLLTRKSGGTIVNQEGMTPINVSIPSLNIPQRSPIAINIPGLPSVSPYAYNAISPCMCNGAVTTPISRPLITYSTTVNEGNAGPNIYNYSSGSDSGGYSGLIGVPA